MYSHYYRYQLESLPDYLDWGHIFFPEGGGGGGSDQFGQIPGGRSGLIIGVE